MKSAKCLYLALTWVPRQLFWHVSVFLTKSDRIWVLYVMTAGPKGWLWGRYLVLVLWTLQMAKALPDLVVVLDVGLSFWATSLIAMGFGTVCMLLCLFSKYLINRNKPHTLQFIKKLENARR